MPINANGKLDRGVLPPPPSRASRLGQFVAPRNPVEHQIAGIWEDLFGIAPLYVMERHNCTFRLTDAEGHVAHDIRS